MEAAVGRRGVRRRAGISPPHVGQPIWTPRLWSRFWAKVAVDPTTGCWIWTGARSQGRGSRRTGHLKIARRWWKAHRLSLIWSKGEPVGDRTEAGHRCPCGANSLCVNPSHLTWVTREENEADKRRGSHV